MRFRGGPRGGPRDRSRPTAALCVALLACGAAVANASDAPEFRSIDGSGNSFIDPLMGSAGMSLPRRSAHAYGDLIASPNGGNRPSARAISNAVVAETEVRLNAAGATDYLWLWGQFLDHDLDLVPSASPAEPFHIAVPAGDPWFDPFGTGTQVIPLSRSAWDRSTGRRNVPRRQVSSITAWIDASNVYGSDMERATALRRRGDRGDLRTSRGKLLPFNTAGLPNAGGPSRDLFLAGDERANEQVALTAMHTLWVREHNRIARSLAREHPGMSGDEIYERARAWVGAEMQVITYQEFLPILLGPGRLPPYRRWSPDVDGSINNEFATAAYRFGHSMVSSELLRLDRRGRPVGGGPLPLREAFFNPDEIREHGIDPLLRGLAAQQARALDNMIVDELRNFLFGPPGAGGFDLASLNIQRGRDHGLDHFNAVRRSFGLRPYRSFDELTADARLADTLDELYGSIENIDLWVGGLAEAPYRGGLLGETFHAIVKDQFLRLRDGDRFYYERMYGGDDLRELQSTRLADVVRRNTGIGGELPDDVFRGR